MAYRVKLSKKNQGTIPVDVLEDLGFQKNVENNYLILVKDIRGGYRLVNQLEEIKKLAGSLAIPKNLRAETNEDLERLIELAKEEKFKDYE
jgi:hypothetical protein